MTITYEVWLNDMFGNRMQQLANYAALTWVRSLNSIGSFSLDFARDAFDANLYQKDRMIEILRYVEGGSPQHVMTGFLRKRRRWMEGSNRFIRIVGYDGVYLLTARIIGAAAGSAQSTKNGPADDVMKEYVREQLGSLASGERNWSDVFGVQADFGLGPSVRKGASRRALLTVLQELSAQAAAKGTRIFFDVVNPTPTTFEFATFLNQRGVDRTTSSNPTVFSDSNDTLINPVLDEDATDEATNVYAGGLGIEAARMIGTAEDWLRAHESPFARREKFINLSSQAPTQNMLDDGADEQLRIARPRIQFTAEIQSSDTNQYDANWSFGDRIYAVYDDDTFICDVQTVMGVFQNNAEMIASQIQYVSAIE